MKQMLGREYDAFIASYDKERSQGLRVNGLKADPAEFAKTAPFSLNPVAWAAEGFAYGAEERPGRHPYHDAGVYYIQEPSAMIAASLLNPQPGEMILDLCAAPGGKSTQAAARLGGEGLLVSNEIHPARAKILSQNIERMGIRNAVVTNEDSGRLTKYFPAFFDGIIVDAPCSGEGMFRKDEGAISEWSVQNVENCRRLQREIVSDIWPCLKPGGLMIYSTCTFNAHEDEENAAWIAEELGADFVEIAVSPEWNITGPLVGDNPSYRFLPGTSEGEGLFMTVLRKHGQHDTPAKASANKKQNRKTDKTVSLPLTGSDDFETRERGDRLVAIPKKWADVYDAAAKGLNVIHAGITIGTRKGKDIVPDQSLALSTRLDRNRFASVDIDYTQAINFLRKEAVPLPDGTPKGFVLLTYKGMPLGFEKNIGNRANNLYPQEWKIKSQHIPEQNEIIIKRNETIS